MADWLGERVQESGCSSGEGSVSEGLSLDGDTVRVRQEEDRRSLEGRWGRRRSDR